MSSPYGYGYGYDPGQASDFWGRAQESSERRYQDTLSESRAERAQRLQIANGQLKNQRDQIAVSRGTAEADRWYKEQQVRLAESELGLDREKLALQGELGRGELALGSARLGAETGLGLLNLRSQLRGPGDWAQYLDLGEGFTTLQPSSGFLTAISQGRAPSWSDTAFGGQPTPASLQGLAGNTQDAQRARLQADMGLANQIAGNVGKVNPAVWGQLSPDRMDYMSGLWEAGGHSAKTLLDAANRAGIGQGGAFSY